LAFHVALNSEEKRRVCSSLEELRALSFSSNENVLRLVSQIEEEEVSKEIDEGERWIKLERTSATRETQ
jgi:hypothetical protein